MSYARNNNLLGHARSLRKEMTKEERHLWYDFLRYCRPRFRKQEIIANFIIDFFCHDAQLAIELDGSQHCEPDAIQYDLHRTSHLNAMGITLVRFSNLDVQRNFRGVCDQILSILENRGLHPSVAVGDSSSQGEP